MLPSLSIPRIVALKSPALITNELFSRVTTAANEESPCNIKASFAATRATYLCKACWTLIVVVVIAVVVVVDLRVGIKDVALPPDIETLAGIVVEVVDVVVVNDVAGEMVETVFCPLSIWDAATKVISCDVAAAL